MIRKHSKKVLGGMGIDGREGENFSRDHAVDPWNPPAIGDGKVNSRGHGKYTSDESGLRNKAPGAGTGGTGESLQGGTRDILENIERNSNSGTDRTGPIKYGVD
jgi:hypothetical protein